MKRCSVILALVLFAVPAIAAPNGKVVYNAHCAGCHGANGNVQTEKARVLKMDVRKLSLKVSKKTNDEMIEIIENGRGDMPGFRNNLSKEQILAIVNYVMTIRKR